MKKATWKLLVLVVLSVLLIGLASTALAYNNAFSFSKEGNLGTGSASLSVPLKTKAASLKLQVWNKYSDPTGEETKVDTRRFKFWTDFPNYTSEHELNALKLDDDGNVTDSGKKSLSKSFTNVAKKTYKVSLKGYSTTINTPYFVKVSGKYQIALSAKKVFLKVGETKKAVANVEYADDVTIKWTAGTKGYFTVKGASQKNEAGKWIANRAVTITGTKVGSDYVYCSAAGQKLSLVAVVVGMDKTMEMDVGETATLKPVSSVNHVSSDITWSSSDASIVTVKKVTSTSPSIAGKLTAKKEGTATITATVKTNGGPTYTLTCKVTVKKGITKVVNTGNDGRLALRKSASKSAGLIGTDPKGWVMNGAKVRILKKVDSTWVQVRVLTCPDSSLSSAVGNEGYVMSKYLKDSAPATPTATIVDGTDMIVKTGNSYGLKFRSSKDASSDDNLIKIAGKCPDGRIPNGKTVHIVAHNSTWAKITYGGKTGYVQHKFLSK